MGNTAKCTQRSKFSHQKADKDMTNQQQIQEQLQKPAQASSKARSKGKILKVKQQQKALENAVSSESWQTTKRFLTISQLWESTLLMQNRA
jgi:hypothetical protein